MGVLLSYTSLILDQYRVADDHGLVHSTFMSVLFIHLERRVTCHRPANGIVIIGFCPPELIDIGKDRRHVLLDIIQEIEEVRGSIISTFGAGTVI